MKTKWFICSRQNTGEIEVLPVPEALAVAGWKYNQMISVGDLGLCDEEEG